MKTKEVQQSLEEFVLSSWGTTTQLAFDNEGFNSDIYDEFAQLTIRFGPSIHAGMVGCYRVFGLVMMTLHVRSDTGIVRLRELTDLAMSMLVAKSVVADLPLVAPVVQLKAPDVTDDFRGEENWVKAQVSCPFFYHVEIP